MDSKAGILCLPVQMALLHHFPGINILENVAQLFRKTRQHDRRVPCRFCLAKNQLSDLFTLRYSVDFEGTATPTN
jgi:hypothetical protein